MTLRKIAYLGLLLMLLSLPAMLIYKAFFVESAKYASNVFIVFIIYILKFYCVF